VDSGGPHADRVIDEIAASFLRTAADTLTARLARDLPRGVGWLESLAGRLGIAVEWLPAALDRARASAASALKRGAHDGQRPVTMCDAEYPALLKQIPDPPVVLWTRGDPNVLSRPAVAVVGARAASPAGLAAGRRLARDLADAGLVVTSGLARGVDGAAHLGALDGGGTSAAVLGCGLDVSYPPEHEPLAARVAASGVLASELPPGTPPMPYHFPLRNRIISGLCRAVVVIEASERSGSLITARMALEQGRDVLAVPGGIASGRYRGSHALIKDGARLVETVEDVLEEIGWPHVRPVARGKPCQVNGLETSMGPGEPCSVDELAERTGRHAPELLAELAVLELDGRVARTAGGCFVRVD
jgi:DNA processing protein